MRWGMLILGVVAAAGFAANAMAGERTGRGVAVGAAGSAATVFIAVGPFSVAIIGDRVSAPAADRDDYSNSAFARLVFGCGSGNVTACRIYNQVASTVRLPSGYAAFGDHARSVTAPRDPSGLPADPLSVAVSYR